MKEAFQPIFGKILFIALWISLLIIAFGGVYYLIKFGNQKNHYGHQDLSVTIIKWGIIALILTQFLRVALVALHFLKNKEIKFVFFSLFILILLIFSFTLSL